MLAPRSAAAKGRHQATLYNAAIHSKKRTTNLIFRKTLTLQARKNNTYKSLCSLESVDPVNRILAAAPLLTDPVRGVHIEAARIQGDVPESQIPADRLNARASALKEYQYYRQLGHENTAEKYLRQGLALLPLAADLHHTLGLLLVRKINPSAALIEFAEAVKLAPDNPRYAYVYAIALHSAGKSKQALAILKAADKRHAFNPAILNTWISLYLEAGDNKAAPAYARKATEALPENPQLRTLIEHLTTAK
jgi:tetratricopeptide (TPR) repeat protein